MDSFPVSWSLNVDGILFYRYKQRTMLSIKVSDVCSSKYSVPKAAALPHRYAFQS